MTQRRCGTCKHYQGPGKICGDGKPGRVKLLQADFGSGCSLWEEKPSPSQECVTCEHYDPIHGCGGWCNLTDRAAGISRVYCTGWKLKGPTDQRCNGCAYFRGYGESCTHVKQSGFKPAKEHDEPGCKCQHWKLKSPQPRRECGDCYMFRGAGVKCRHKDGIFHPVDGNIRACDDWSKVDPSQYTFRAKHVPPETFTINSGPAGNVVEVGVSVNVKPDPMPRCYVTWPEEKKEMSKKAKKLIEKIENAFGGKVEVEAYDELDSFAALKTLTDGVEITRGRSETGEHDAVKALLYDLQRRARRILKVKK